VAGSAASSAIVHSPSAARMRSRTLNSGSRTLHLENCSHCPSSNVQTGAATSIAVYDPDHVRIAAAVLGHRSFATTERHYNLATSLKAARSYQAELQRLRTFQSGSPIKQRRSS